MTQEEKHKFDYMNNTAYLLRLLLEKAKFEIQPIVINNDCIYHILKNGHTIGTLVSRYDETLKLYHNNIRLYKYFKEKFPKAENFLMGEYWIYADNIRIKFNFEKFNEWCNEINNYVETLGIKITENPVNETYNDAVNRLTELLDEYDEKFTSNSLVKDIRKILNENERMNNELKKREQQFFNLFLRLKL